MPTRKHEPPPRWEMGGTEQKPIWSGKLCLQIPHVLPIFMLWQFPGRQGLSKRTRIPTRVSQHDMWENGTPSALLQSSVYSFDEHSLRILSSQNDRLRDGRAEEGPPRQGPEATAINFSQSSLPAGSREYPACSGRGNKEGDHQRPLPGPKASVNSDGQRASWQRAGRAPQSIQTFPQGSDDVFTQCPSL